MHTPNTPNTTTAQLDNALAAAGIYKFRHESGYPESNAQHNLSGRTHYVDADTLRAFKSRILSAYDAANGLLFVLIESVRSKPYDTSRTKRAVIFDVFGTVLFDRDQWHSTSDQADKAARAFLAEFDAVDHTRQTLERHAARLAADAAAIRAALNPAA